MALLGEQLLNLAKAAGMSGEEPELKSFLSNTAVAGYELPDAVASKLNSGLLSWEAARNNSKLKSHYLAVALNGLDGEIENTALEFGFSDDEMETLKSEKSTTRRAIMLSKMKVQKLQEELKDSDKSKGEKADLKKRLDELNAQIRDKDKLIIDKVAEVENQWKDKFTNQSLVNILAGQSFADDMYRDENYLLPLTKIKKALGDKGLKLVLDNEVIRLEQHDGAEYYENNVKVDTKTFIDGVLAQNRFLKVSEPNNQANPASNIVVSSGQKYDAWRERINERAQDAMVDLTK